MTHAHEVIDAEPELVLLASREQRQPARADKRAVSEERGRAWQERRALWQIELGVEIGFGIHLRHRADGELRLDRLLGKLHALRLAGVGNREASGHRE